MKVADDLRRHMDEVKHGSKLWHCLAKAAGILEGQRQQIEEQQEELRRLRSALLRKN